MPQPELTVFPGGSPAITLTGKVTDAGSAQALQDVRISVVGEGLATTTAADGSYSLTFEDRWAGRTVTVIAQSLGYRTQRKGIQLREGANTLSFSMDVQPIRVDSIALAQYDVRAEEARMKLLSLASPSMMEFAAVDMSAGGHNLPGRFNPNVHTEDYNHIQENRFLAAATNPLSTFSIDVDRASYANVRRFIHAGTRPPIDAVRIEELINYFPYGDPAPDGEAPLAVYVEVAPAPWQPLHRLVRIALKGRPVDPLNAPPSNLVFLLDVSGIGQGDHHGGHSAARGGRFDRWRRRNPAGLQGRRRELHRRREQPRDPGHRRRLQRGRLQ
jgi:Ca-activated chloride channel family protein